MNTFDIKGHKNETEMLLSKINIVELLNNVDEGILIVNKNFEIIFYNRSMEKIEGMQFNQIKGKNIFDIFPGLNNNNSTIIKAIKEGMPSKNVLQTYHTILGRKITVISTTLPIFENNKIVCAIDLVRDISTVKEMSLKLIDLQNEVLSDNNKSKVKSTNNIITFDDIIGNNVLIKDAIEIAKKSSLTLSPVLISGETGTGKELFAKSIHNYGKRHTNPFIAINCAALPEGLLEGILFGTVSGGFTDAVDRPGVFEQANGGTILLDEINSMDLFLQSKLLRVIEERKVQRIGGLKKVNLDLKIISTTNTDLKDQISKGKFREDLFYRLNVVNVVVPPLRDRKDDLPILINHFLEYYNNLFKKNILSLSDELIEIFNEYNWPGNIRELKHCIESGMNLVDRYENIMRTDHLSAFIKSFSTKSHLYISNQQYRESNCSNHVVDHQHKEVNDNNNVLGQQYKEINSINNLDENLNNLEKKIIIDAILKTNGNIAKAAQILGIKRQTLSYKIKRLNIKKKDFTYTYNGEL